jgi:hypothetical protein
MDALIPHLASADIVGLERAAGILGEREGYPDYIHLTGYRFELKLIYVDNPKLKLKRPPTRRERSARLTQKVTVKNVDPTIDAMLLISYQLSRRETSGWTDAGWRWFGNYETPAVISKVGKTKQAHGQPLDITVYGRKESEGAISMKIRTSAK